MKCDGVGVKRSNYGSPLKLDSHGGHKYCHNGGMALAYHEGASRGGAG
jgi:hypothetical protein